MSELLKCILTVGGIVSFWCLYTWWMCRKDRKEFERWESLILHQNEDVKAELSQIARELTAAWSNRKQM